MCDSTSIDQFSPPMQPYPILVSQSQTINSLSFSHTQPIPDPFPTTTNHPIPSQSIHHSPSMHPDPESACVIPPLSTSSVHPCSHTQSSFHNHKQSILSLLVIRNQFLTLPNNHHHPPSLLHHSPSNPLSPPDHQPTPSHETTTTPFPPSSHLPNNPLNQLSCSSSLTHTLPSSSKHHHQPTHLSTQCTHNPVHVCSNPTLHHCMTLRVYPHPSSRTIKASSDSVIPSPMPLQCTCQWEVTLLAPLCTVTRLKSSVGDVIPSPVQFQYAQVFFFRRPSSGPSRPSVIPSNPILICISWQVTLLHALMHHRGLSRLHVIASISFNSMYQWKMTLFAPSYIDERPSSHLLTIPYPVAPLCISGR